LKVEVLEKIEVKYLDFMFQREISRICYKHTFHSVADVGCLSRIPDPNFYIPDPASKKIQDPGFGSAKKNLSIFNPLPKCTFTWQWS
jgi:hypothetical protein